MIYRHILKNYIMLMREEKILIVEDEMTISAAIKESLYKIGYNHIEIAFSAEKAVELIEQNFYDVILRGLKPDRKDGMDVIEETRKIKDVPVIYVTSHTDKTDLQVQLELLLHREKLKRIALEEKEQLAHLYTGDLSGMMMTLNLDGRILYVTPHIYKITGKHTDEYINKTLAMAGFEKTFYEFLEKTFKEAKNFGKRNFYGTIYSPYIGQRMVNIKIVANGCYFYHLQIDDVTDHLYKHTNHTGIMDIAGN